jgi:chromosome segregation ATPase
MSDTPRTDEALYNGFPDCRSAVDFARQLERELAAATKERDDLQAEILRKQNEFLDAYGNASARALVAEQQRDEYASALVRQTQEAAKVEAQLDDARAALKEAMKGPVVDAETWALNGEDGK